MSADLGTVAVTRHDAGGTWLIALEGEHDITTAMLREEHTRCLEVGSRHVIVDLSGADFIDSSVVNWLMRTQRTIAASGTVVLSVVEGPPAGAVARLLGLVGLRDEIACYPTRQDAFAAASASGDAAKLAFGSV